MPREPKTTPTPEPDFLAFEPYREGGDLWLKLVDGSRVCLGEHDAALEKWVGYMAEVDYAESGATP